MGREKLCRPQWAQRFDQVKANQWWPSNADIKNGPANEEATGTPAEHPQAPRGGLALCTSSQGCDQVLPEPPIAEAREPRERQDGRLVEVIDDAWAVRKLAEIRRRSRTIDATSLLPQTRNGTLIASAGCCTPPPGGVGDASRQQSPSARSGSRVGGDLGGMMKLWHRTSFLGDLSSPRDVAREPRTGKGFDAKMTHYCTVTKGTPAMHIPSAQAIRGRRRQDVFSTVMSNIIGSCFVGSASPVPRRDALRIVEDMLRFDATRCLPP